MADRRPVVIPAVLERDPRRFQRRVAVLRRFARHIHLDAADGRFVRGRTVAPRHLALLPRGPRYELHLMVIDPSRWLRAAQRAGISDVIVHVEHPRSQALIRSARQRGFKVGLAINPQTDLRTIGPSARLADWLVCLSVRPGRQGAPFIPSTLQRIRVLRRTWRMPVVADGGVTLARLPGLRRAGATRFVVGSAITLQPDPALAYRSFVARLRRPSV